MLLSGFCKAFQAQHMRKYPRWHCGSVWYHLELQGPTFDRVRQTFSLFSRLFTLKSMKIQLVPFIFKRTGNHAQIVDLAMRIQEKETRALHDRI